MKNTELHSIMIHMKIKKIIDLISVQLRDLKKKSNLGN